MTRDATAGTLDIPEQVAHYRVERLLASGGMGSVYVAYEPALDRRVALKFLSSDWSKDKGLKERFAREAQASGALHHPNVVPVHYYGELDGRPFFTMELVDGESLKDRVARAPLSPAEAVDLMHQAAMGLAAAYETGRVHRDVKPSNLLVTTRGVLKVADFGLAKVLDADASLTGTNMVVGTPYFSSPEQARGDDVDCRSDLYSLGATFYFALSGRVPFDGSTPMGILLKHINDPLPPLRPLRPSIPAALCSTVERLLAKRAEDRFQSYGELVEHLRGLDGALSGDVTPAAANSPTLPSTPSPTAQAKPSPQQGDTMATPSAAPPDARTLPEGPAPALGGFVTTLGLVGCVLVVVLLLAIVVVAVLAAFGLGPLGPSLGPNGVPPTGS